MKCPSGLYRKKACFIQPVFYLFVMLPKLAPTYGTMRSHPSSEPFARPRSPGGTMLFSLFSVTLSVKVKLISHKVVNSPHSLFSRKASPIPDPDAGDTN